MVIHCVLDILIQAGGVHAVATGEPDSGFALRGILEADGAVREVLHLAWFLVLSCLAAVPPVPMLPGSSSCAKARKSFTVGLVACPCGLSGAAPVGCPTVFKIDMLRSVDNVLKIAVCWASKKSKPSLSSSWNVTDAYGPAPTTRSAPKNLRIEPQSLR